MLVYNLITIFPEFFLSPLSVGLLGKAIAKGILKCNFYNPRDFSKDVHHKVDDRPFGGGPGMIMTLQPLVDAINSVSNPGKILLMSPAGAPLTPQLSKKLAAENSITLICGRYEGIDARIADLFPVEEISVGQAILNGGETAALAIIESCSRFLPGFMSKNESTAEETFSQNLLEYPQYTRPANFQGNLVPPILCSGDHARIKSWRRKTSLQKTLIFNSAQLNSIPLTEQDIQTLKESERVCASRNLSFCLFHYPVKLDKKRIGTSSLTNLDIHDISRISHAYSLGPFYILTPLKDQLELLKTLIWHWKEGPGSKSNPDRADALRYATPIANFEELEAMAINYYGVAPTYIVTSAQWPKKKPLLSFSEALQLCSKGPVIICLGTAQGLDLARLPFEYKQLRPLRFLNRNHLSVRSAAAIIADRILGDYN